MDLINGYGFDNWYILYLKPIHFTFIKQVHSKQQLKYKQFK